ncbi:hypothetical protein ACFWFZ_19850 [Streptomyces sp. NPDC060232]|uniref:hypothetical protein n=1 Tax=Streptomyces sp. NPDC060232 TaxID=3347079 RepID=UPI00365F5B72
MKRHPGRPTPPGQPGALQPKSEVGVREKYRIWFVLASLAGIAVLIVGGVLLWVNVSWTIAMYPLWIGVLVAAPAARSPFFRRSMADRRLYLYGHGLVVNTTGPPQASKVPNLLVSLTMAASLRSRWARGSRRLETSKR